MSARYKALLETLRKNLPLSVVILIASIVLLGSIVGISPVFQVSEAREGVVVQEIFRTGEIVLPLRHGTTIPSKPPLFHWLSVLLSPIDPGYSEFGLRLPSMIAAVGVVLLTSSLAAYLFGATQQILTALILLTSYGFLRLATDGRVDMLFCFFMVAAITVWIRGAAALLDRGLPLTRMSGSRYLLIAACCGFAILSKGPLGFALVVAVIGAIAGVLWGLDGLRSLLRPQWALALAIAVPWYLCAAFVGRGAFVTRQVVFENVARLFGGSGIVAKPPWFYLQHIWTQAAPWSILLCAALCLEFWSRQSGRGTLLQLNELSAKERFGTRAACIWAFVVLLLISLSIGKRRSYILPALPALALLSSVVLSRIAKTAPFLTTAFLDRVAKYGRVCTICIVVTLLSAVALSAIGLALPVSMIPDGLTTFRSLWPAYLRAPFTFLALGTLFFGAAYCCLRTPLERESWRPLVFGGASLLCGVFFVLLPLALAMKGVAHTYKDYAQQVSLQLPPGQTIQFIKKPLDESFDGFFFYYRNRVELLRPETAPNASGYYIARRKWFERQSSDWLNSVELLLEGGRPVDTPEERLLLFRR